MLSLCGVALAFEAGVAITPRLEQASMTKSQLLLSAAVISAASFVGASAQALPVFIGYSTDGGANVHQLGNSGNDGGASVSLFAGEPGYSISLSAVGSPVFAEPNFGSNTLTVRSTGAGNIILYASETGLTTKPAAFSLGFTNNPLSDTA